MGIVPEEDITGYVVRQSFEASQGRVLMTPYAKTSLSRPGWAFPSGLESLVSKLDEGLPTLEEVISNHTRYPLYSPFLTDADQAELLKHCTGTGRQGITALVGGVAGARSRMAVCTVCIKEDKKRHGYAVWRRLHLMPGIVACHVHQSPLLTFCDVCESGHRRERTNWKPRSACVCGCALRPVATISSSELDAGIAIAQMADQILRRTAGADITSLSITHALRHYYGADKVARRRLADSLNDLLGHRVIEALGIGSSTVKRLLGRSYLGPVRNPIQNIAALYVAFGSLDKFSVELIALQKTDSHSDIGVQVDAKVEARRKCRRLKGPRYREWVDQLPNDELVALRNASRRWLLDIMAANPDIKRAALWRERGNYSALRFLMHVDTDWFDELMPTSHAQRNASTELALLNEISRLTEYIKLRYETSLKRQPWRRVTKTFLLSGTRSEAGLTKAIESDEVQASLVAYAESHIKHRERLVRLVCNEFTRRASNHVLGDAKTYMGISDRSCLRRILRARKWLSQNGI